MADCSQVFLGLPNQNIDEEDSKLCNWSTNKLGGRPDWMERLVEEYPSCKLCKRQLLLVSQVYCPLSDSPYHRTLYIFGCVSPSCWNQSQSWTVVRSQQIEEASNVAQPNKDPVKYSSVDDWGDDAGDWGDTDEWNAHEVTELEYATSKLSLNHQVDPANSKIPIPVNTDRSSTKPLISCPSNQETLYFQPYYINVFENSKTSEETDQTSLTRHERELVLSYQEREGISIKDAISVLPNQSNTKQQEHMSEGYEKTAVAHGDKGFHKFQKYLQQCPQQCIRYEWNGTLLSISSSHTASDIMSTVPRCQYCGSQRVYELQLMPALVVLLRIKDSDVTSLQNENIAENESNEKLAVLPGDISRTSQGIEFGTVIVFSCGKSCWEDNDESCFFREEFLVVQADPDAELFKNEI